MLSARLINLIETHQNQIAANAILEIRRRQDLSGLRKLSDAELRERAQHILEHLGHWLSKSHEEEIELRYEAIGKNRFEASIPLHESIRVLTIIKDKMIDFAHDQGLARTSLDLYAEGELERRVGQFFDELVIHMVRGYETAWRRAACQVA